MNRYLVAATATVLCIAGALASPSYTGYSGAPGARGACASTCHGNSGGTIAAVGFPISYIPGQTYVVSVVHRGGSSIRNFNGSVRVGTGSEAAGTITAGFRTTTYSRTQETNGIHLSGENEDSCTFSWQAPDPSVGDVRLYVAGLQGSYDGDNTELVIVSSPATGIEDSRPASLRSAALSIEPSVVGLRDRVRLTARAGAGATLRVTDRAGRIVARVPLESSSIVTTASRLVPAAGTYVLVLQSGGQRVARKLTVR